MGATTKRLAKVNGEPWSPPNVQLVNVLLIALYPICCQTKKCGSIVERAQYAWYIGD